MIMHLARNKRYDHLDSANIRKSEPTYRSLKFISLIIKVVSFNGVPFDVLMMEQSIVEFNNCNVSLSLIATGCLYDVSFPVMHLAVLSADNAYNVPNFEVTSECRVTNQALSLFM